MKPLLLSCCLRNTCNLKCKWKYTYRKEHLNLDTSYLLYAAFLVAEDDAVCKFKDKLWWSDMVYLHWEDQCQ